MKLLYTQEAVNDLRRLRESIEVKNLLAARKVSINIRQGINKLITFPKIGLPVSKVPDQEAIRDLYVSKYTVRYLIQNQCIYILRFWHNKENEKDSS